VLFETTDPRVPFAAVGVVALKLLVTSVDKEVRLQVAFSDEPREAIGALKWSFACVRANVGLEITSVLELGKTVVERANQHFFVGFWTHYLFDVDYFDRPLIHYFYLLKSLKVLQPAESQNYRGFYHNKAFLET